MATRTRLISYGKWQRILIAAICVSLAYQVNTQTYTAGFIIALSPFFIPIFLYYNKDINPLLMCGAIGIASPIFRGVLLLMSGKTANIPMFVVTDVAFFACYGFIYYFLYWRPGQRTDVGFFGTIILCDYLANLLEVSLLTGFADYSQRLFELLFLVAFIRSILSCLAAFLYHYFTLMIREETHEKRYYHFIWTAAAVKSEVYFMNKNISEIENVMKNAYQLNQNLQQENSSQENQDKALAIARDVHEIKKDYQNVIKGLGESFADNQSAMKFTDILKVVTNYIRATIRENHQNIIINVTNSVELVIPNHYYLVSIISNLIFNSIDALNGKNNGLITLTAIEDGNRVLLTVTDNGTGMTAKNAANIFRPGFTTKYNVKTGDVYRGIGLSHVKIIVEEQFGGTISVESEPNVGTTFNIMLNKQRLLQEGTK